MSYSWQLLANDWDSLTDSQKEDLFLGTDYVKPTVAELQAIGEPFKIATYTVSPSTAKVHVLGVPSAKLVLPKALFGSDFENINSMIPIVNETGDGKVRFIVTINGTDYYTWDGSAFVQVSSLDADTVIAEGMDASTLASLTVTEWSTFFTRADEIGIGFALEQQTSTDTAKVDALTLSVDMTGYWKKAVHMTDYDYRYASTKILKVELLTDGTYKINYPVST